MTTLFTGVAPAAPSPARARALPAAFTAPNQQRPFDQDDEVTSPAAKRALYAESNKLALAGARADRARVDEDLAAAQRNLLTLFAAEGVTTWARLGHTDEAFALIWAALIRHSHRWAAAVQNWQRETQRLDTRIANLSAGVR